MTHIFTLHYHYAVNNKLQMIALACLMRTLMEESETHFLESLSIFCQHLVWDRVYTISSANDSWQEAALIQG